MSAMDEINIQKRLRDASVLAAEAGKVQAVKRAEAECEATRLSGEGAAGQREAIAEGLKRSLASPGETLTSEKVSELLLILQYFDILRRVGGSPKRKKSRTGKPSSPARAASNARSSLLQVEA